MKIRKLVISGFGPYASRQELDFETNIDNASMFVISGNTGAGKTTIFDAIAYALYGEASGTGRDGSSLRSDFADVAVRTEVELLFSLRGDEYRVNRSPAYERAKQRGAGTTKKDATAELTLPDGKVRTGAKDVTCEIEQILGLTSDQFRQLVMIPQGEFRRFLSADASQKEEIFRKIFGTEVYVRIQNIARERARRTADQSERLRHDRRESIRKFMPGDNDADLSEIINSDDADMSVLRERFDSRIAADRAEEADLNAELSCVNECIERLSREHSSGVNINRDFDVLESRKAELARLDSMREDFELKERRADKSRKALAVRMLEKQLLEKMKESEENGKSVTLSKQKIAVFEKRTSDAEAALNKKKERDDERTELLNRIKELDALKDKTERLEKAGADIAGIERSARDIEENIASLNDRIALNERDESECESQLSQTASLKERRNFLVMEMKTYDERIDKTKRLIESSELWLENERKHAALSEGFPNIEEKYLARKSEYEHLERLFMLNQAGIIARGLADGSPCPVCGSTVHPKKAVCDDTKVSEEALRESREKFDRVRSVRDSVIPELTSLKKNTDTIYKTLIAPLAVNPPSEPAFETVSALLDESRLKAGELERMKSGIAAEADLLSKKISREGEYAAKRDSLRRQVNVFREEIEKRRNELSSRYSELGSAKTLYETLKADFGGMVRTRSELNTEAEEIMKRIETMKKELEAAEYALNTSRGVLDSERGNLSALEDRGQKIGEEVSGLTVSFNNAVSAEGFRDVNEYRSSLIDEAKLKTVENEIRDYRISFEKVTAICGELEKKTEGLKRVDLAGIENELTAAKDVRDRLDERRIAVNVRIRTNETIVEECRRYTILMDEADAEYRVIGHISKVLNGDNPRRISFERYVLAAYFDDIISAANIRFRRMTGGRFEMMRKVDAGDKRKALGLEMEVHDNYTGRARGISTLSGGESFKASLCLALGMADVVQSHAGGIQLDTMFIDEGFGTLDPESLDSAIESLMELRRSGRLVGIISHVPELKERIGARIEVTATEKGSSAVFAI